MGRGDNVCVGIRFCGQRESGFAGVWVVDYNADCWCFLLHMESGWIWNWGNQEKVLEEGLSMDSKEKDLVESMIDDALEHHVKRSFWHDQGGFLVVAFIMSILILGWFGNNIVHIQDQMSGAEWVCDGEMSSRVSYECRYPDGQVWHMHDKWTFDNEEACLRGHGTMAMLKKDICVGRMVLAKKEAE